MSDDYFVFDIETCPIDPEALPDDTSHLNPIQSKIVGVGVKKHGTKFAYVNGDDEKILLEAFWELWDHKLSPVGYNCLSFDLPFLVARSLVHEVKIKPFLTKSVIDLRDKINAYRYGHTRGKLKEYAKLCGIHTLDMDGSHVADLCKKGDFDTLKAYLMKDLDITDSLFKRARKLNITKVNRW